jgi:ribose 5-phosphate isomerase B
MTIFIGADHRGFEMKNRLIEYIQEKNIRVEDLGAYEPNAEDDYPDFSKKVTQAVLQKPDEFLGILVSSTGVGMAVAANRFKNIRCALGFSEEQVKHAREDDNINILSLPSDFIDFEKAKAIIDIFITTEAKKDGKYIRRIKKLDHQKV